MKTRRPKVDGDQRVLSALIIEKDFLEQVHPIIQPHLFRSADAGTIARWCLEHWNEFGKAPENYIHEIFEEKQVGLSKTQIESIQGILDNLNLEQNPDFCTRREVRKAEKLMRERASEETIKDAKIHLSNGDVDACQDVMKRHLDNLADSNQVKIENAIITSTELSKKNIKRPKSIIGPWLRERSINMIHAERGIGKTWLSLIIGIAVTSNDYKDNPDIGPWRIRNPAGVLYIDGEMGLFDMKERIESFRLMYGPEHPDHPLHIFSAPEMEEQVNLNKAIWQNRITKYLEKNPHIRIVIIDNLSSLTFGKDENSNQEESVFNSWLIRLKGKGLSIITVHHDGKGGGQRGASGKEDPLTNSIQLKRPKEWSQGDGASFDVIFTKARHAGNNKGYLPFRLRLLDYDGALRWSTDLNKGSN